MPATEELNACQKSDIFYLALNGFTDDRIAYLMSLPLEVVTETRKEQDGQWGTLEDSIE